MADHTLNSETISNITHKENQLTGQPEPIQGGPTAQAQKHANEKLDGCVVSDIAKGEESITHHGAPVAGGPASMAQSEAAQARNMVLYHLSPLFRLITMLTSNTGCRHQNGQEGDSHRNP